MRYVDYYEQEEQFCIVTDHYEGLDLYEALRQRSSASMNEFEAAEIIKQILEAVLYLQENGVTQWDLRAETVILSKEKQVTLVDYSLGEHTFDTPKRPFR